MLSILAQPSKPFNHCVFFQAKQKRSIYYQRLSQKLKQNKNMLSVSLSKAKGWSYSFPSLKKEQVYWSSHQIMHSSHQIMHFSLNGYEHQPHQYSVFYVCRPQHQKLPPKLYCHTILSLFLPLCCQVYDILKAIYFIP